jgi:hypothetical protein
MKSFACAVARASRRTRFRATWIGYNRSMLRRLALGVAILCSATACRSHWTAEITQPALLLYADKPARTSWPLTIVLHDMELRYARLANTAYYVVVSRDRFRFHLTLRHKWEAMSDIRTWNAWVEDDSGAHHNLEEIDQKTTQLGFGRVSIYRGDVAFTVYGRNLFAAGQRVTLVLRRPGYEYRYVWNSEADPET